MLGLLGAAAVGFYKRSSRSAAELLLPTVQVAYKVKKRNPDKGVEVYYKFLKKTQATGLGPGGLTSRYWYKWDKLPEDWSGNTLPHPIPEHDIEPGAAADGAAAPRRLI